MPYNFGFLLFLTVPAAASRGLFRLPVFQRMGRWKREVFHVVLGLCAVYLYGIWRGSPWIYSMEEIIDWCLLFLVGALAIAFLMLVCKVTLRQSFSSSSGESARMQDDQPTRVKSISYHAEKPWMILSFYSGHVVIWKNDRCYRYAVCPGFVVRACKFLRNDLWAAASDDKQVRVFNLDGKLIHKFQAHDDFIRSLEVHPTRPYLLSASDDMKVKLWDAEYNYESIRTYQGHLHYVMQVKLNPNDTTQFATASLDRTIKFWSLEDSDPVFTLEGHEQGINDIDFLHGDDNLLVSGSDDRTVKVWNYQTRQLLHSFSGHTGNVTAVLFHTSNIIASTSEDCSVRFWNYIATTDNSSKSVELLALQYVPLGRGWSLATATSEARIAVGLDQACIILDTVHDQDKNTLVITKEQNITNQFLKQHEHAPVEVFGAGDDESILASVV